MDNKENKDNSNLPKFTEEPRLSLPEDDKLDSLSVAALKSPAVSRKEFNDDAERDSSLSGNLPSVKSSLSLGSSHFTGVFQPFTNNNSGDGKGDLTPGQVSISDNQPIFLQKGTEGLDSYEEEHDFSQTVDDNSNASHLINRLQNINQNDQVPSKRNTWAFPSSNSLPVEGSNPINGDNDPNQPLLHNNDGRRHIKYGSGSEIPKRYSSKPSTLRGRSNSHSWTSSRALDWLPFNPNTDQKYDEDNKRELVEENNGLRVWYDDYTSIGNLFNICYLVILTF
jgi:hypothetical protein